MQDNTEWHSPKAESNIKKHRGLTFDEAVEVFSDPFALEEFDEDNSTENEFRYRIIGRIKRQVVIVVVYTPRNGNIRVISARYASAKERQVYYDRF